MAIETTLRDNATITATLDYQKMHEVAKHIHDNPADLNEFVKDPEGFVFRFNGLTVPEGHHLHIADAQNNLYPPEEEGIFGSDDRTKWGRNEIRVGYKTVSLVECA